LKENGYKTHWFHGNTKRFFRRENFFLKHGFDQLHDEDYLKEIDYEYKKLGWGVPDTAMVRYAVDVLKQEEGPFFAEIMTLSNHHPFNWNWPLTFPQEMRPHSKHPMDRYRHGIYFTDHAVGLLMQLLEEADLLKNTYVVFLGDHGIWMFDKRKGPLHESQEYEQYFRLPFILTGPGIEPGVIQAPSSQVDVSPTLLDLLGLKPDRAMIGRSMLDPNTPEPRAIWMHQEASFNYRNGDLRCHIPMGPCRGDKYLRCFTGKKEVSQHVCFESSIDLLQDPLTPDSLVPVSSDVMKEGLAVSEAVQKLLRANKIRPLKDTDISNYMTGKKLKKKKKLENQ
jgi:phosphoglycerol transferase MdoB-like AlkP superfamily enzyme